MKKKIAVEVEGQSQPRSHGFLSLHKLFISYVTWISTKIYGSIVLISININNNVGNQSPLQRSPTVWFLSTRCRFFLSET